MDLFCTVDIKCQDVLSADGGKFNVNLPFVPTRKGKEWISISLIIMNIKMMNEIATYLGLLKKKLISHEFLQAHETSHISSGCRILNGKTSLPWANFKMLECKIRHLNCLKAAICFTCKYVNHFMMASSRMDSNYAAFCNFMFWQFSSMVKNII